MNLQEKSKDELINKLQELQQEMDSLKAEYKKCLSEKRHAEQKLNKIDEKNRFRIEFLTCIKHEIRTPMGGITGFSLLLQDDHLESSEIKQYAGIINQSVNQLRHNIDDFFDFLSIEAGRKARISETNVVMAFENIYSSFKPHVEAKGIQFSFKNRLPLKEFVINTDENILSTILAKLILNALYFTRKGSIEIGCALKIVTDLVELEFYIKDTGMGIPQEKLQCIFKPYNVLLIYNLPQQGATGLELFIAKSYVELLGGTIRLESIEGKGSTFYFTIPGNRNYEPHPN